MVTQQQVELARTLDLVRRAEECARIRALYHPTLQQRVEEQLRAERLHQQGVELFARLYLQHA